MLRLNGRGLVGGLVACLVIAGLWWVGWGGGHWLLRRRDTVQVRLCVPLQPASALFFIALRNGYFEEEGVEPIVRTYVSGKRALAGLLADEGDLTTSADIPIVFRAFEHPDLRILTQIGSTGNFATIVARRDAGIQAAKDLRGKRIATQKASAVHFFLHLFLVHHGLSESDLDVSFMRAEELPQALADGRIDAFCMREPFVSQAEHLLGDRAVKFQAPGVYFRTEYALTRSHWIEQHPGASDRIVRALVKAQSFAVSSPEAACGVLARSLDTPVERIAEIWPEYRFAVTLEQASLAALEDEARWAIKYGLVEHEAMPDFFEMMHWEALDRVRPRSVTVIH